VCRNSGDTGCREGVKRRRPDTDDAEVREIPIPRRAVQRGRDANTKEGGDANTRKQGMLMPRGVTLNDQG
jgi:hypothetical protein